ncbi:uncharacterized protein LOC135398664 [Ornithodoros turicata]|uniref:uncharacterized protein LOC135398664 n=1 Tax=Ornithodoros turicata TaxID=34597 RepID=UPI003139BA3C
MSPPGDGATMEGSGNSRAATPATYVPAFNAFAIELPEKFDFRHPESWKKWFTRWERYRVISGLHKQDMQTQVNTFLYAMGSEAEDIITSLRLSDEELNDYGKLSEGFKGHFVPRLNVIYERACFNQRHQRDHETVEEFVRELHRLAATCEYGALKEELIRDRLVVGLHDKGLSEKLQLDSSLTLEKAVNRARNSEAVKGQQPLLHSDVNSEGRPRTKIDVDAVIAAKSPYVAKERSGAAQRQRHGASDRDRQRPNKTCKWCGYSLDHTRADCPAREKVCSTCRKTGHFASVCQSSAQRQVQGTNQRTQPGRQPGRRGKGQTTAKLEEVFLGEVLSAWTAKEPWIITAEVDNMAVSFMVDTGADVSAVPQSALAENTKKRIRPATKVLYGPGRSRLHPVGQAEVQMSWNGKTTRQEIFVMDKLEHALLGRPAIRALDVLPHLCSVESTSLVDPTMSKYPALFGALGHMKAVYHIKLVLGAVPHAVSYPRRVPIPLLPSVKEELERMEELQVIEKVDRATSWCAPMVVAKKKNGKLRI